MALREEYGTFDFSILDKYKKPTVTVQEALSDIEAIEQEAKKYPQGTSHCTGTSYCK